MKASNRVRFLLNGLAILSLLPLSCAPAAAPPPSPQPTTAPLKSETPLSKPAAAAPSPSPKPAAEQPRYGGVLAIAASVDPPSFDIHQETSISALEPTVSAYDGLVQYDLRTGEIVGDLAEKWEMSADGLTYTFTLRKDVKFHDGKPFSSEDVRYNLARQKDPPRNIRSARKEQFASVDKIEAPDANTVRIIMKQPYVAFMPQFATDGFVIYPKHVVEAKGDMKTTVLGTGPFKFKSYAPGVSVEFVKNPDYFMKGLPYLDGLTHYIIKDGATRFSAFRTGRVKLTGHFAQLTPSEAAITKAENPTLSIWRYPALQGPWYVFNGSRAPFNDVRVRQAAGMALDRQTAIKVLGEGEAKLGTFLPPGPWGLPEQDILKLPGYRQKDVDRAEAKKLLAEAGFPNGFKMTLTVRAVRLDQKAGEFLKDQLASVGIDATIEVAETAVYNQRTASGNFELGVQQVTFRINDPDELSRKFLTGADQNYGKWSSRRFDDLFAEQSRALDPAKRKALTRELDDILLKEWPSIFPYWGDSIIGSWPEVKNFAAPPGFYSSLRNTDLWLAK
ncbi:MAG: ABC transporter substrate-binding protein [Chloroflexi bacterium]|nr:ABC transporter substrate-binding protein [Chloroflexota bacterium]